MKDLQLARELRAQPFNLRLAFLREVEKKLGFAVGRSRVLRRRFWRRNLCPPCLKVRW